MTSRKKLGTFKYITNRVLSLFKSRRWGENP